MNELRVETHLTAGEIACNFDDLEAALKEQMTAYAGLEVTEDNIPERKKDVATLRKFKDALDTRRKEVKKEFNRPLDEFEKRVKALTGIVDKEVERINEELDVFEQRRKAEKRELIRALYKKTCDGYEEYVKLPAIYNDKWENKTYGENEIVSEMQEHIVKVKSDLAVIRGLHSDIEEELIADYKLSGQLTSVIAKDAMYREAKSKAEERAREEAQKQVETVPATVALQPDNEISGWDTKAVKRGITAIRISGEENVKRAKELLDFNEIPYEEV